MSIENLVQKLLDLTLSIESIQGLPSDQLIINLIDPYTLNSSYKDRIYTKVLYSLIDSDEKYGNTLELLLLDDQPIFFYTRGCKWLDTYCIYHISKEHTSKFLQYLQSHIEEDYLDEFMTEDKLLDDSWFGKYNLFNSELPIILKE